MTEQMNALQIELDATFEDPLLKQNGYVLHSVLMHEGVAGSGHYFSYILDHVSQKWWKFSDIYVQ